MTDLALIVCRARRALGLSQVDLAGLSGVSLATVQNLEAGRANPSLSTLEKILRPLGLGWEVRPESADWEVLAACGLPLGGGEAGRVRMDVASFAGHVRRASLEIDRLSPGAPDRERKLECLQALLLAVRTHFPGTYRMYFARSPLIRSLLPARPSGRVIKLGRLARAALAEFL